MRWEGPGDSLDSEADEVLELGDKGRSQIVTINDVMVVGSILELGVELARAHQAHGRGTGELSPPSPRVRHGRFDLRLPDRDGWWVVDEFRRHPEMASVPIVIVSGSRLARNAGAGKRPGIALHNQALCPGQAGRTHRGYLGGTPRDREVRGRAQTRQLPKPSSRGFPVGRYPGS